MVYATLTIDTVPVPTLSETLWSPGPMELNEHSVVVEPDGIVVFILVIPSRAQA